MKKQRNHRQPGWHGSHCYFGFHHDLHADLTDKVLGTRCSPKEFVPMLKLTGAEFVQTDTKGHPGLTTWKSKIRGSSVAPGLVKDALMQWRAATRKMGLPLHAHYSGLWDHAAGFKHPDWCLIKADGRAAHPPYTIPKVRRRDVPEGTMKLLRDCQHTRANDL
jgi:alpha-L-fucosidase